MNFTPELLALQGVILSADNINSFSELTERGGNENKIKEVVKCVKNFLVKEKYINDVSLLENNLTTLRKFAFYIVLNADLPILQTMVEKDGIDFLIWTVPTIPKCLMCEMMWKLHMDKFVNEVIAFCCPQLSLEVAESFINHMKYINPTESAGKVTIITAACYKQMCRLNFFNVDAGFLNQVFSVFHKCLNYFVIPPNIERLQGLTQNQMYKFIGKSLHTLLLLVYECFDEYYSTQKFELGEVGDIYMSTYSEENIVNKEDVKTFESKKEILDYLFKCHEALLDVLKELVMSVSVDIYCTWCEFEENGKSMQQVIGELCYKLRAKLANILSFADHPVVEMLHQISCKPVEIKDIINSSDSEDIIKNIKNNIDRHLWIQALLDKHHLCHDLILVENLTLNLKLLKNDDFPRLYNICFDYISNFHENKEAVKELAIKAFQLCDPATKLALAENTFNGNCFTDEMESVEYDNMSTEIFNKLIASPDADLSQILTILIQNPKKTFKKIFFLAAENIEQSVIFGRTMKYLKKYSNYYYNQDVEACVTRTLQDVITCGLESEKNQNNFINFIFFMKDDGIISGAKLLLLIIMPNLYEAMLHNELKKIHLYIKMLSKVYTLEELLEYRAPLLAMIAQVLDVVRWKAPTYNALKPSCLELAIELQTSIFKTYENNIPENEMNWLMSKVKKNNPLNLYYYKMLWNPPGDTYLEVLTGINLQADYDSENLKRCIAQILRSTVLHEWFTLWNSLTPFTIGTRLKLFRDNLIALSKLYKDKHAESWECLLYCYRNFFQLIRYKYLHEPITEDKVVTVIDNIAALVNLLDEEKEQEFQPVPLPLLAYLAEKRSCYTNYVKACIKNSIKSSLFASMVENILFTHNK